MAAEHHLTRNQATGKAEVVGLQRQYNDLLGEGIEIGDYADIRHADLARVTDKQGDFLWVAVPVYIGDIRGYSKPVSQEEDAR